MAGHLRVVDGGGTHTTGEDVMSEIRRVLDELLPHVPLDDQFRSALRALYAATGGTRTLRAVDGEGGNA